MTSRSSSRRLRLIACALALPSAGLAGAITPWPAELAEARWLLVLLGLALFGLGVELLVAWRSGASRPRSAPSLPLAGPTDGIVGLATVRGVRSAPYRTDESFGKFLALEEGEAPRPRRPDVGPPRLLGRVALLSLFVGRDGRSWSDDEISRAHKALRRTGEWVEREAIRWGMPIHIELATADFVAEDETAEDVEVGFVPEGDDSAPLEAFALEKALASASRAAARLGFADVADLAAQVEPRLEAETCVWLLHLRRAGRSIAAGEADSGLPGVNLAVCYAREASFPEPLATPPFSDPITFVHELLHLFGASDKYGVSLATFPAGSVTERDVMCLEYEGLSRLRVDGLTAFEVGWAGTPSATPPHEPSRNERRPPRPRGRGGRR